MAWWCSRCRAARRSPSARCPTHPIIAIKIPLPSQPPPVTRGRLERTRRARARRRAGRARSASAAAASRRAGRTLTARRSDAASSRRQGWSRRCRGSGSAPPRRRWALLACVRRAPIAPGARSALRRARQQRDRELAASSRASRMMARLTGGAPGCPARDRALRGTTAFKTARGGGIALRQAPRTATETARERGAAYHTAADVPERGRTHLQGRLYALCL